MSRAISFQGYKPFTSIQPLLVQRYGKSGHYVHHYDWFGDDKALDGNTDTTFLVYLRANCTGGGTHFPRLEAPAGLEWCEFIDCDHPNESGITFKPITGNAVFWANLDRQGHGHKDTLHAGRPVVSGIKMILNIWTWSTAFS